MALGGIEVSQSLPESHIPQLTQVVLLFPISLSKTSVMVSAICLESLTRLYVGI